jgi:2,3-bisphosphoglycerate-independent phosphoglycerate mutase
VAVANETLAQEQVLKDAFQYAKDRIKVHFLGLVSDGGVHSHTSHLRGLIDATQAYGLEKYLCTLLHRRCRPKIRKKIHSRFTKYIATTPVKIASVIGRYYAMDRDKRWERVKLL